MSYFRYVKLVFWLLGRMAQKYFIKLACLRKIIIQELWNYTERSRLFVKYAT